MLGVFLFFVYFTVLCLFIGFTTRQKARTSSFSEATLPKPSPQGFSKNTADDIAWWVKIVTETPHCTYFFGPFDSSGEAKQHQSGYVEDLEQEGAKEIGVLILQDCPLTLTIYDDED